MDSELGGTLRTDCGAAGAKALPELRLELFQAEQRILDAQVHADYYRARLAFCESVLKIGIEQVSDKRKEPEMAVATLRSGPKLTAAQSA